MNDRRKVLQMATGGMMAAVIFVATCLLKLPVPITSGYIHLGDGLILLGAALLGAPAIPAAALGSMLADLMGGYTLYLLPTFVIKGLTAAIAVRAFAKPRPMWQTVLWLALAEACMVLGYFLAEWLMLGYGLAAASGAMIPNLVQGAAAVPVALVLLKAMKPSRK